MKIKDLPPPIKRLAKRNVEKQHGSRRTLYYMVNDWDVKLIHAFTWSQTIEDYEYWYQVDNGNFHFEPRKEVKL